MNEQNMTYKYFVFERKSQCRNYSDRTMIRKKACSTIKQDNVNNGVIMFKVPMQCNAGVNIKSGHYTLSAKCL